MLPPIDAILVLIPDEDHVYLQNRSTFTLPRIKYRASVASRSDRVIDPILIFPAPLAAARTANWLTRGIRERKSLFVYSGGVVINQYIAVALRRAHYELLENGEGFYGSIPELAGVWAQSPTLEVCRDELKSALEDWLLFSLSRQVPIPVPDGIDLVIREVA